MGYLHTTNKVPAITRSTFTQTTTVTFPAGGLADQTPIINLAMTAQIAAERIDRYLDVGATDVAKGLDVLSAATMLPLYLDPALVETSGSAMLGILPPKCVLMRCLEGSGLIYLNLPSLVGTSVKKVAPIVLHAGAGLFSYAFPRDTAHVTAAAPDPAIPAVKATFPLTLMSIYLRTFEAYNRFQLIILK